MKTPLIVATLTNLIAAGAVETCTVTSTYAPTRTYTDTTVSTYCPVCDK